MGYREVELPNLFGHSAREVRAAADRAGLAITSLHLPLMRQGAAGMVSLASEPSRLADTLGELGTRWVVAGGNDPVAFLRRLHGRVSQLHVKDVAAGNTANFAIAMTPADVGTGVLSWRRVLEEALCRRCPPLLRGAGAAFRLLARGGGEGRFRLPRADLRRRRRRGRPHLK